MALRISILIFTLICLCNNVTHGKRRTHSHSLERKRGYRRSSIITTLKTISGDTYDCVDIYEQPGMDDPTMDMDKLKMLIAKELEKQNAKLALEEDQSLTANSTEFYDFNPRDIWLNKKGCPMGSVPIRRLSTKQLKKIEELHKVQYIPFQKTENQSYLNTGSFLDFAGIIVPEAPSGYFIGAKATMTIWKPKLRGDHQYSSASIYVENGDNQIRSGWIVYPALYGDFKTRLFSRWTSDNYGKTGCYVNHCPGFIILSNFIPLDYAFPMTSAPEGTQYDVTIEIIKVSSNPPGWYQMFNGQILGMWTSSIFSSMSESAIQLRFGGECFKPEGEEASAQMGSGVFVNAQYDKTSYMRQITYTDLVYGGANLDNSRVQVHESRCYYVAGNTYNTKDPWYAYNFFFGGRGGEDEERCVYS
ncbi:unnamed protein product [Cuscuta epithymum]|uniref:Neprosin PEP catalytic domain-containing protein n=1 Tax=Cuscuta epithymum TaxID=186058 RepID=A0AAV0CET2_9ASTE|nr:unnamed protein product [Cuscuta epithymum]